MIGFDTNLVVRLLVEDDPRQLRRVRRLLAEATERDETVWIGDLVLCELEWVLESAYGVRRPDLLLALSALVADERFGFEDRERVRRALALYQAGRGDLSDYLLGLGAEEAGARTTFTFDRALRGDARFTPVPA